MDETEKAKSKLDTLNYLLDDLEDTLEPLFKQPLLESLIALDQIQQAKLQTVLPYVVYDLIFIYLKAVGTEPTSHPIVAELQRVKQYFEKIKNTESPDSNRFAVDKEAASRFIKHAISQVQLSQKSVDEDSEKPTAHHVPTKLTSKMLQRDQYFKEMEQRDLEEGSQEEDLEVFSDQKSTEQDPETPSKQQQKKKRRTTDDRPKKKSKRNRLS